MKASVITPVWNRADLTFNFLNQNSFMYGDRDDIEFIIINNGSTDGTLGVMRAFSERLNLIAIHNPQNVGFGAANNQGANKATGKVLIFINNDVRIYGDYVDLICRAIGQSPNDLTGAELLAYDTGWNTFNGVVIPYIHGWCLAASQTIFDELGGFDERYSPGDYEDIDFCYTAIQKSFGLQPVKLPLVHLSGQTARQLPDRRAMTERHRQLFIEKWGLNGTDPTE